MLRIVLCWISVGVLLISCQAIAFADESGSVFMVKIIAGGGRIVMTQGPFQTYTEAVNWAGRRVDRSNDNYLFRVDEIKRGPALGSPIDKAIAQDWKVGNQVVVPADANLMSVSTIVARVPGGTVLEIRELKGDWIRVEYKKLGWIKRNSVISIKTHIESECRKAEKYLEQEDFERARDICAALLAINSDDASVLVIRARINFATNKYQEAIDDFTRAIKTSPRDARLFSSRGLSNLLMRNYDNAILDLTIALHMLGGDKSLNEREVLMKARIADLRGDAWLAKGDRAAAISDYTLSATLHPQEAPWLKAARVALDTKDAAIATPRLAVECAWNACKSANKPSADAWATLATAFSENGSLDLGIQAQKKAVMASNADSGYLAKLAEYQKRAEQEKSK